MSRMARRSAFGRAVLLVGALALVRRGEAVAGS